MKSLIAHLVAVAICQLKMKVWSYVSLGPLPFKVPLNDLIDLADLTRNKVLI